MPVNNRPVCNLEENLGRVKLQVKLQVMGRSIGAKMRGNRRACRSSALPARACLGQQMQPEVNRTISWAKWMSIMATVRRSNDIGSKLKIRICLIFNYLCKVNRNNNKERLLIPETEWVQRTLHWVHLRICRHQRGTEIRARGRSARKSPRSRRTIPPRGAKIP